MARLLMVRYALSRRNMATAAHRGCMVGVARRASIAPVLTAAEVLPPSMPPASSTEQHAHELSINYFLINI